MTSHFTMSPIRRPMMILLALTAYHQLSNVLPLLSRKNSFISAALTGVSYVGYEKDMPEKHNLEKESLICGFDQSNEPAHTHATNIVPSYTANTPSAVATTALRNSSLGCGQPLPEGQTPGGDSHQAFYIQSNGFTRTYLIHIPTNYVVNKPVPLIFSFHGHGKSASQQEVLSQFSNEGHQYNPNAMTVYPQGLRVCSATP
jgi:hypothetical protein